MSTVKCPHCGRTVGETDAFCPFCGKRITYSSRCPVCGNELNGAKFCSKCGYKVKDKSSEVSAKAKNAVKNVAKSVWDFIKNHKKIFIIVAAVILIAVIVIPTAISLASPFRQAKVKKIELGVTTQEDIKKKFGDPTDEYRLNAMSGWNATLLFSASLFIGTGNDVWVYYESSVAKKVEKINEKMDKAEDFDELDKLDAELEKATKKPYKSIVVAFDDDGKVTFIALNMKTKYDDSDLFATSETKTLKSVELSQNKVCIGSSVSECKLSYTAKFSDKSMIKGYVTELDSAVDTSKEGAAKISFSNDWGKYSANINVVNHEPSEEYTVDVQPTCIAEGSKSKRCTICGYKFEIASVPRKHTYQDGYCTVCGKKDQSVDMKFSYDYDKEAYVLYEYKGSDSDVEIPDTYDDGEHGEHNVIAIGYDYSDGTFRNNKTITSVYIPNSIIYIGRAAFENCSGLTSVTIPDGVTSIGNYAFYNCSGLTSVTIGSGVTSIGYSAFYECSGLTTVNWNATACTSAGDDNNPIFDGCTKLSTVNIENNVTLIPSYAFYNCSGLTSITIPDGVTSIGNYAFSGCSGLTSVTIGSGVTSIGDSAFYGCSGLTSITIPDSVTSIGESAFYNCSGLTSITIPDSVTSIGRYAFLGCSGLTSITIPDSVTSIGYSAFRGCSGLTSITIPDSVTSIGYSAFRGCSGLTSITIPDGVTSIGEYAFYNCSGLTEIRFNGTMSQWKEISKDSSWNYSTGNYKVYCTDGTLDKYGNVI